MALLTKPRAGELDLESDEEREVETDRHRALWNDVLDACRAVVREFGGYDKTAAALQHVWGPLGHTVTASNVRATLSVESERNYFRGEWLIWFSTQSETVADLLAEIAGRAKPKKTPEQELRDLQELLRAELPRQADKLIRKAGKP